MKPLGTITKYYPFLDEDLEAILNSFMDVSSSYFDFVNRLCALVLATDAPDELAYLAAVHAWWCRIEDTMNAIQEKYGHVPCIRPWGYAHANMTLLMKLHDPLVEAIEEARAETLEDWMETELHLLHSYFHYPYHGDIPSLLEPLERARGLIDANPLLRCFEPLIYALEGYSKQIEGDAKESLGLLQKGQELAESFDDSLYKYVILVNKGDSLRSVDLQLALALYEELYELAQDLEVPYLLSEVLNDSAIVFEVLGEYDLAISSHREVIGIIGENFWTSTILSRIYAFLGNGRRAFEEISQYIEREGAPEYPSWGLCRARSLALLGRVEEAERDLNAIHAQIIESGSEMYLGIYYHVSGLIEMARGNYADALDFLERAEEISERVPHSERNYILLSLSRLELMIAKETRNDTGSIALGHWLIKLEKHAKDSNLPGVGMQAALLKSEFYEIHGQIKDAQATLMDALAVTDSLGVKTLRNRITSRIQEIDQIMASLRRGYPRK